MKLQIFEDIGILKTSPPIELPDLVILTGENGSGKTQLLEFLADNLDGIVLLDDEGNRMNTNHLIKPGYNVQEHQEVNENLFRSFEARFYRLQPLIEICAGYLDLDEVSDDVCDRINRIATGIYNASEGKTVTKAENFANRVYPKGEIMEALALCKKTNKIPRDIGFLDFFCFVTIPVNNLFSSALSLLFKQFGLKKKYYPESVGEIPSPWDLVNKLLDRAGFDYYVDYKYLQDEGVPTPVTVRSKTLPVEVNVNQLSSGEQSIMSLVITLYNIGHNNNLRTDVLLLDEPDAFLHPSLADAFINTVNDVLVKEHGIKVIMSTHSPSTVALAPTDRIFVMDKKLGYPVEKTREEGVRALTSGLAVLNVSRNDRKQIFTEAERDAHFYQTLFENLVARSFLKNDQFLLFISCGLTKVNATQGSSGEDAQKVAEQAGCDRVIALTEALFDSGKGNRHIFGLLDWDTRNQPAERILVFGQSSRYSIENFIFDPLFICCFGLIHANQNARHLYGIEEKDNYNDMYSFPNERLQTIITTICNNIYPNVEFKSTDLKSQDQVTSRLLSGMEVQIPRWFLETGGHQIEDAVRKTFLAIKKFKLLEFIDNVVVPNIRLLPVEVKNSFEYIQKIHI